MHVKRYPWGMGDRTEDKQRSWLTETRARRHKVGHIRVLRSIAVGCSVGDVSAAFMHTAHLTTGVH